MKQCSHDRTHPFLPTKGLKTKKVGTLVPKDANYLVSTNINISHLTGGFWLEVPSSLNVVRYMWPTYLGEDRSDEYTLLQSTTSRASWKVAMKLLSGL
jgi:hypothetical protein